MEYSDRNRAIADLDKIGVKVYPEWDNGVWKMVVDDNGRITKVKQVMSTNKSKLTVKECIDTWNTTLIFCLKRFINNAKDETAEVQGTE